MNVELIKAIQWKYSICLFGNFPENQSKRERRKALYSWLFSIHLRCCLHSTSQNTCNLLIFTVNSNETWKIWSEHKKIGTMLYQQEFVGIFLSKIFSSTWECNHFICREALITEAWDEILKAWGGAWNVIICPRKTCRCRVTPPQFHIPARSPELCIAPSKLIEKTRSNCTYRIINIVL